mgnify:CR=1 FL=1
MMKLPRFKPRISPTLSQSLLIRSYTLQPVKGSLPIDVASRVLFAAHGCTGSSWGVRLRTTPSAGGTYPLSIEVVVRRVEGVESGVYRYVSERVYEHELKKLSSTVTSGTAPLTLRVMCKPERTTNYYGSRGYMYINEEVGHLIQSVVVECGVLGLTLNFEVSPAAEGVVATIDVYPAKMPEYPASLFEGERGAEEALARRRSIRNYTYRSLSKGALEYLVTCAVGPERGLETYPPVDDYSAVLYVAVSRVDDMGPGVYLYDWRKGFVLVKAGDVSDKLSSAALGQDWIRDAAVNFIIASRRGDWRSEVEAGMIGQNIYLAATAIRLGTVAVGAFRDQTVSNVLGIVERPLYIMPVGVLA